MLQPPDVLHDIVVLVGDEILVRHPAESQRRLTSHHPDVIDDAELIALYEAQYTFREIGEQLGCSPRTAYDRIVALRQSGMDLPARMPRWTDEARERLARMRREGRSLNDLEIEFERARGTITSQLRTLRRLGYDIEPRS